MAVGPGVVVITATSEGSSSTVQLTVVAAAAPVARVVVNASPDTLEAHDQAPMSAWLFDAATNVLADRQITWSSSNPPWPRWTRRRASSPHSTGAPSS